MDLKLVSQLLLVLKWMNFLTKLPINVLQVKKVVKQKMLLERNVLLVTTDIGTKQMYVQLVLKDIKHAQKPLV